MTRSSSSTKVGAAVPCETWRRNSTKGFLALNIFIFLVFIGVHWVAVGFQSSQPPVERVLASLEEYCSSPEDNPVSSPTQLPPLYYGLAVWVDSPVLLPGVHAALALMKKRLTGSQDTAAGVTPLSRSPLHSFVRLESRMRDETIEQLIRTTRNEGSSRSERVAEVLETLVSQQQIGLPTLKHVFLPEAGQEVDLIGLSLFSVPVVALPGDASSKIQCFLARLKHAYCVFPVDGADVPGAGSEAANTVDATATNVSAASLTPLSYRLQSASLEIDVRAAVLSVVAQQIKIASFKAADVAVWRRSREHMGCLHAIASLKSTLRTLAANTLLVMAHGTEKIFEDLERHVKSHSFLRAAQAADSLLFHPSLSPQLYIPWDHALVTQMVILLPALTSMMLMIRFTLDERRSARLRAKAVTEASSAKKEQ